MKRIAVNFRLEAELLEQLKTTAKQKSLSKTAMLEECLRASLSDSANANGERKIPANTVSYTTEEIQSLVNTAVEQKVKTYYQDIENAIAQLQNDLAELRKSPQPSGQ